MNEKELIELLNINLKRALKLMRRCSAHRPNILVRGATSDEMRTIVSDWAAANKINLHYVDARTVTNDTMFEHYERGEDGEKRYVRSTAFDPLDRPNSVLYIDNLNLLQDLTLRSALIQIPKDNYVVSKQHIFSNLLFTIARVEDVSPDDSSTYLGLGEMGVFVHVVDKS